MQTISIAICEENENDTRELLRLIELSGISADIYTYENTPLFLEAFRPGSYHLVFFDIYFGGTTSDSCADGVETARIVREKDSDVWIAFTTSSPDFATFGYTVNADRYILKPPDEQEVISLLEGAAKHFSGLSDELIVTVDRKRRAIPHHEILYIEANNKQSVIHLKDEVITTYAAIDVLERMLKKPSFLRCHRSYIVNMDHIESAGRDFTMHGGGLAYISHTNQWKVRKFYQNYISRLARNRSPVEIM